MLYNCKDIYKFDIGYKLLFTFVHLELSIPMFCYSEYVASLHYSV